MSKHIYTYEECIRDLKVIQEFYQLIYGAEPECLGYAVERLETLSKYKEVKVIGETREE